MSKNLTRKVKRRQTPDLVALLKNPAQRDVYAYYSFDIFPRPKGASQGYSDAVREWIFSRDEDKMQI